MRAPILIEQDECESVIHDHDCDFLVTKVRGKDIPDSDLGDFRCRRDVDSSSYLLLNWLLHFRGGNIRDQV